jgi:hypothetical protein
MIWIGRCLAIMTLLHGLPALADDIPLLICSQQGILARKCKVQAQKLADPIVFKGLNYETEYRVQFLFSCQGDPVPFGFSADSEHRHVSPVRARSQEQSLTIKGSDHLWAWDPAPPTTEGLNFRAPCQWAMKSVSRVPTETTMTLWRQQEKTQAELVIRTSFLVGALRNFASYRQWDQETTRTILSSVKSMEAQYQKQCDEENDLIACDASFDLGLVRETLENKVSYDPTRPEYQAVVELYEQLLAIDEKELADMKQHREAWGVPE